MTTSNLDSFLKPSISVRSVQMEIPYRDYPLAMERVTEEFENSPAMLTIFPEACTSGFSYDDLPEINNHNRQFLEKISFQAARLSRGLILPLLIREGDHFFNRLFFISAKGAVTDTYDKIHLIGALNEDRYLTRGNRVVSVPFDLPPQKDGETRTTIRIGLATCYDLRFPELFRALVYEGGADIICVPAFWPKARASHFTILARSRAIENQIPVITANGSGRWGRLDLCGESMVIDAKGNILQKGPPDQPARLDGIIDLVQAKKWREDFPALQDPILFSPNGRFNGPERLDGKSDTLDPLES